MRTYVVAAVITVGLVASNGAVTQGQAGRQGGGGRGGAAAVPNAPTAKTAFWSAEDIHHFTDVKGFRAYLIRVDTLGVVKGQATAGRN